MTRTRVYHNKVYGRPQYWHDAVAFAYARRVQEIIWTLCVDCSIILLSLQILSTCLALNSINSSLSNSSERNLECFSINPSNRSSFSFGHARQPSIIGMVYHLCIANEFKNVLYVCVCMMLQLSDLLKQILVINQINKQERWNSDTCAPTRCWVWISYKVPKKIICSCMLN